MQSKTFRLFISSTFSDFSQERRLLQTYVFPEIKQYCIDKGGYAFQPIDLRWGVSNEAQLDQKTLELCINEVKASKNNPHPNFLIMVGDRYGWVPTPYAVEQNEFEKILEYIKSNNSDIEIEYSPYVNKDGNKQQAKNRKTSKLELLTQWYKLDENQLPASYILDERTQKDINGINDYTVYENWATEEAILREILQTTVETLKFNEKEKLKYFRSATEHEVIDGIFKYLYTTPHQEELKAKDKTYESKDYEHVYGYIREIKSLEDKNFEDDFRDKDYDKENSKVSQFKKNLKAYIKQGDTKENGNLLRVEATLLNLSKNPKNGSLNYTYEAIENEQDSIFVKTMIENLKRSINAFSLKEYTQEETEIFEQQRFKDDKVNTFLEGSRTNALRVIESYIDGDNKQPLVIYGKSGLGKSSLMAKAIDEAMGRKAKGTIVYRFVGAAASLNNTPSLLISILKELGIQEGICKITNPQTGLEESEKLEDFYNRICNYLKHMEGKTTIFIDAVDQLSNDDEFLWLPSNLPDDLKIVLSALEDDTYPDDSKYFESLKAKTTNLYQLEPFEDPKKLVNNILFRFKRTITNDQMEYLLSQKDSSSPLYLTVAAQEVRYWKSYDYTDMAKKNCNYGKKRELATTQKMIINEYISNLTELSHHDNEFVKRVFSYIYLTGGLSESELLEIINTDQNLVNNLAPDTFHTNVVDSESKIVLLPIVIWSRLHFQIKEFLKLEEQDGYETMKFFRREFGDAVKSKYNLNKMQAELIVVLQTLISQYQHIHFNNYGKLYIVFIVDQMVNNKEFKNLEDHISFITNLNNINWIEQMANMLNTLGAKMEESNFILHAVIYQTIYLNLAKKLYLTLKTREWKTHYMLALNDYAMTENNLELADKKESLELLGEATNLSIELMHENDQFYYREKYFSICNNFAYITTQFNKEQSFKLFENLYKEVSSMYMEDKAYIDNFITISHNYAYVCTDMNLKLRLLKKILHEIESLKSKSPKVLHYESIINASLAELYISLDINIAIKYQLQALDIVEIQYKKDEKRWEEIYAEYVYNLSIMYMRNNNYSIKTLELLISAKVIFEKLLDVKKMRIKQFYNSCVQAIEAYESEKKEEKIIGINCGSEEFELETLLHETISTFNNKFIDTELVNCELITNLIQNLEFKKSLRGWLISCANLAQLSCDLSKYGLAHEFSEIFIDCCGAFLDNKTMKSLEQAMIQVYNSSKSHPKTNHIEIQGYEENLLITKKLLLSAIEENNTFLVGVLAGELDLNFIINEDDDSPNWKTPLAKAVQSGNLEIVKLLIEHGANIETIDIEPNGTVLFEAVFNNDTEMVELLLKYNAKIRQEAAWGGSPYDYAKKHNLREIIQLFEKHEPQSAQAKDYQEPFETLLLISKGLSIKYNNAEEIRPTELFNALHSVELSPQAKEVFNNIFGDNMSRLAEDTDGYELMELGKHHDKIPYDYQMKELVKQLKAIFGDDSILNIRQSSTSSTDMDDDDIPF